MTKPNIHLKNTQQRWNEGYYGALVGATITKVESYIDDTMGWEETWTKIYVTSKDGEEFILEISRDEEGNGPGFLFGLPMFTLPEYREKVKA